jgi:hypothetical protein
LPRRGVVATLDLRVAPQGESAIVAESIAMSFKQDVPRHAVIHFHVPIAGAGGDVYTGEAIADALIASWQWLTSLLAGRDRGNTRGLGR